jgi:hypothetical protein
MNADDFFSPATPELSTNGRPRAVNPRTGKEQSWTRPSSHANRLDNPHGLVVTRGRKVIAGLSRLPHLARAVMSGAAIDDKAKTDEIIASALEAAEDNVKSIDGTAAHAALSRSWRGEEVPEEFHPLIAAFAKALREHKLTPVMTETCVLNLTHDTKGTLDWIFREDDGNHVVGDVKTGRIDVAKRKFAVQLADYDGADYILASDGTAEPMRLEMRHTHAVLVHIDLETLGVSVYRVDLHVGRWGAWLADQIAEWQKVDPLSAYVAPISTEPRAEVLKPVRAEVQGVVSIDDLGRHIHQTASGHTISLPAPTRETQPDMPGAASIGNLAVGPLDERELIDQAVAMVGGPEAFEHLPADHPAPVTEPRAGAVFSSAHQQTFPSESALVAAHAAGGDEISGDVPTAQRFDELMAKHDKAALQNILKSQHGWTDGNHNRRWLARAIIAIEDGMADAKAIVKFAAAKDDGTAVADVTTLTEAPAPEPQGPSTATHLEAIAGAHSLGAIEAYRKHLVEQRGDQAWTDELAAAAKARVSWLDTANGTAPSTAVLALRQIAEAQSSQDLAQIWEQVTLGNSVPEAWTAELHAAGLARLEAIKAETPPPPTNPFGE